MIKKLITKFIKNQKDVYYFIREDSFRNLLIDVSNKTVLNLSTNTFFNYKQGFYGENNHNKISKEEYDKALKKSHNTLKRKFKCNCKIGDGLPEIVNVEKYNIEEVYNKENRNNITITSKRYPHYSVKDFNNNIEFYVEIPNKNFYKSACLKCETCIDDKQDLFDHVDRIISKEKENCLIERQNKEKAELICKEYNI